MMGCFAVDMDIDKMKFGYTNEIEKGHMKDYKQHEIMILASWTEV